MRCKGAWRLVALAVTFVSTNASGQTQDETDAVVKRILAGDAQAITQAGTSGNQAFVPAFEPC